MEGAELKGFNGKVHSLEVFKDIKNEIIITCDDEFTDDFISWFQKKYYTNQ